jgi:hypothetical protein
MATSVRKDAAIGKKLLVEKYVDSHNASNAKAHEGRKLAQDNANRIRNMSVISNDTWDTAVARGQQGLDNATTAAADWARGSWAGRAAGWTAGALDSGIGRDTSDFLGEMGRQMQNEEVRNRKHANWDTLQQRQQRQKERAEEMRAEADRAGAIAARDEKGVAGERTEALAKSAGNLAADSLGGTAGAGAAGIARMQAAQKARDQGGAQQLSEATQRKDKYENEEVTRRGEANAQQQKAEETAMANQNEQEQQNMENTIERAQMREEWDAQDKLRDEERAARDAHSDENLKEVGPHTGHIGDPEEEEEISEREINRALMRGIR